MLRKLENVCINVVLNKRGKNKNELKLQKKTDPISDL